MTCPARAGPTPARPPTATASMVSARMPPEHMLLTSLIAWPAPTGPAWKMFLPMRASTGRARSSSAGSPPTMIASVPSVAPRTPPETGASMRAEPRAATSAASSRVTGGSAEVISSRRLPGRSASSRPLGPVSTCRTSREGGRIVITVAAGSGGTTGATMTLLSRDAAASPLLVGWSRLAIAAPCLVLAAGAARLGARHPTRRAWPSLRDLPLCAALGLAMAAYQVCYFRAVTLVGVAAAALLAICSAPLLIAVLAAALLGERLTSLVRLSLGMAVAGTALLVVGPPGLDQVTGHFGLGALLALGAGGSYAGYAVAAQGLLPPRPPPPLPPTPSPLPP